MAFGEQAGTRAASVRGDIRFPRRQPYLASPASLPIDGAEPSGARRPQSSDSRDSRIHL
jgi:hypothetical protein